MIVVICRNTDSLAIANTTNSIVVLGDIPEMLNNSFINTEQKIMQIIIDMIMNILHRFIGLLIRYKIINPMMDISIVLAVDTSAPLISNSALKITTLLTIIKSVKLAGNALYNTFVINFPCIGFLLFSKARKNAGIPIVNILINDICDGFNG